MTTRSRRSASGCDCNQRDWQRLRSVWGASLWRNLDLVAQSRKRYTVQMIGGSHLGNARATHQWWLPAERVLHGLGAAERPVYFVSSNTHSIVNVLSGTARRRKDDLTAFIRAHGAAELKDELAQLEAGTSRSNWENLLYFAARQYFASADRATERRKRSQEEQAVGIHHIDASGPIDVGIQIIELAKLDPSQFDPRLCGADGVCLDPRSSDAIIVNVNYPLGLAAYNIMTQIGMTTDELQGIYILGKAATLNGRIGDVMISDVVYDEHSGNTYWFENAFSYADLAPYLDYGAALDNQKAVTVKGRFSRTRGTSTSSIGRTSPSSRWRPGPISTRSTRTSSCVAIRRARRSTCRRTGPERSIWGSSTTHRTRPTPGRRRLERGGCPTTGWIRPTPRPSPSCAASFSRRLNRRNRRLFVPDPNAARGHRGMTLDPGSLPDPRVSGVRDLFPGPVPRGRCPRSRQQRGLSQLPGTSSNRPRDVPRSRSAAAARVGRRVRGSAARNPVLEA